MLNFYIHATLLMRNDGHRYFHRFCGVSKTTMWHSHQISVTISVMFPNSRMVMIVLRQSLHGVFSDGHVFGLFVLLPAAVV